MGRGLQVRGIPGQPLVTNPPLTSLPRPLSQENGAVFPKAQADFSIQACCERWGKPRRGLMPVLVQVPAAEINLPGHALKPSQIISQVKLLIKVPRGVSG